MDASALELNFRKSLAKFLRESLPSVSFMFDWSSSSPNLRDKSIKAWIFVDVGDFNRAVLSSMWVDFYVCTRKDPDWWDNAALIDSLVSTFYNEEATDGLAGIPFYDGSTEPWVQIGAMTVQQVLEVRPRYVIEDETKVKIVSARFRWATKI